MGDEYLLPHEILDGAGVPDRLRADVAYKVQAAKYCALVEAVMKLTGGEPVEVNLERVREILVMDPFKTDPREFVMVAETTEKNDPRIYVRLATVDEIRNGNRRYALSRMGGRRN